MAFWKNPFSGSPVTLEALPSDAPAAIRIRHFLKLARRAYLLKAVEVLGGERADAAAPPGRPAPPPPV
jgi:hypothetical protein